MVERLREKQPKLGITPQEVLCVKIAGLCHDLGSYCSYTSILHLCDIIGDPSFGKSPCLRCPLFPHQGHGPFSHLFEKLFIPEVFHGTKHKWDVSTNFPFILLFVKLATVATSALSGCLS